MISNAQVLSRKNVLFRVCGFPSEYVWRGVYVPAPPPHRRDNIVSSYHLFSSHFIKKCFVGLSKRKLKSSICPIERSLYTELSQSMKFSFLGEILYSIDLPHQQKQSLYETKPHVIAGSAIVVLSSDCKGVIGHQLVMPLWHKRRKKKKKKREKNP